MNIAYRKLSVATALFGLSALASAVQAAGFVEDSHASLTFRNYLFDRNYLGETNIAARREWAQGFILKVNSGFTEGPVGFGLDALGLVGIKLDSSRDRVGTGLLPIGSNGEAPDQYGELGLTAKVRYSKTQLDLGTQYPQLPILFASPTRLLPQTFRGAYLRSQDIDRLSLHVGWLDRVNQRDSTDYQKLTVGAPNGRFNPKAESDRFLFVGGDYALTPELTLRYYHASLQDIYVQDYLGAVHTIPLGPGKLKSDFRYFLSDEDGSAKAGAVDNQNIGAMFSYSIGAHTLGAGVMHSSGDTAMPYIAGSEPLWHSEGALSTEFLNAKERAWQVKYDYDFTQVGLPGLRAMARYLKGTNIEVPRFGGDGLSESERDLEVSYVVQSGPLKNVAFRVRNALYLNDFAPNASFRDDNETRINIDYTLALW
ncbi:MAG TPA: OprD family porin [Pseudomonas sp.]|nr:OprD family porin [Pseudomonas sp.]